MTAAHSVVVMLVVVLVLVAVMAAACGGVARAGVNVEVYMDDKSHVGGTQAEDPDVPLRHVCVHDELLESAPSVVESFHAHASDVLLDGDTRGKRDARQADQPLRVLLDTHLLSTTQQVDTFAGSGQPVACYSAGATTNAGYTCSSADVLTQAKYDWLTNVLLPDAKAVIEEALNVDRIAGNLVLASAQCGFQERVVVPQAYRTTGVAFDLVIFVTARPIASEGTLAFAGECERDATTKRAVAGQLNYSPKSLRPDTQRASQLGTTLHEIAHVLGFSKGKWASFYDPVGGAVRDRSAVVREETNFAGKASTELIYTSEVLAFTRAHFACPTLSGAELEDGGSDGTAGSHWDKRVFMNEFMTGQASSNPVFSALTLALFADSGWYSSVNYDVAEPLVWGRNGGCAFVTSKCDSRSPPAWPREDVHPGYFCTDLQQRTCSFDLHGKATCGLTAWDPAPPAEFRYFPSSPSQGGLSQLADYCPYMSTYEYCTDTSKQGKDGEAYCANCRCFEKSTTSVQLLDQALQVSMGCYEMACVAANAIKVGVDSVFYDCPAGTQIDVGSLGGKLTCPKQVVIDAVCAEAPIDSDWPAITSVEPVTGEPGVTEITVTGTNFKMGATVDIHGETEVLEFVPPTTIKVRIKANDEHFNSPAHLLPGGESVNVIVTNPDMRSTVRKDGFNVKVPFNINYFESLTNWVIANPLYAGIAGVSLLLACLCCIYCCCSGGGGGDDDKQATTYNDRHLYR